MQQNFYFVALIRSSLARRNKSNFEGGFFITNSVLTAIFAVFTAVSDWILETVPTLYPLFYNAESGLTFLGVLAVAGLAFSVVFLLIGIVQRFLHFRG